LPDIKEIIEQARKAQQTYLQKHDVQLEMELDDPNNRKGYLEEGWGE